jgi:hypothetical protein
MRRQLREAFGYANVVPEPTRRRSGVQIRHEIHHPKLATHLVQYLTLPAVPRGGESVAVRPGHDIRIDSVLWVNGSSPVLKTVVHHNGFPPGYYQRLGYEQYELPARQTLPDAEQSDTGKPPRSSDAPSWRNGMTKAHAWMRSQLRELLWQHGIQSHPDAEDAWIVEQIFALVRAQEAQSDKA